MTLLAAVAILAIASVFFFSRWMRTRDAAESQEPAFTLDDLRRMKAEGLISAQEYQAMRGLIIGQLTRPATPENEGDPSAANGPRAGDEHGNA